MVIATSISTQPRGSVVPLTGLSRPSTFHADDDADRQDAVAAKPAVRPAPELAGRSIGVPSVATARIVRLIKAFRTRPQARRRIAPLAPSPFDSAAAKGEWMRRREDPNP